MNLLLFDRREFSLYLLRSSWSPFLNTSIDLASFRKLGNTQVLNDEFVKVHNGSEISLFSSLSIFTVMLLVPTALFALKVFNIFSTFSGVVGVKNNVFVLLFVKKKMEVFSLWNL